MLTRQNPFTDYAATRARKATIPLILLNVISISLILRATVGTSCFPSLVWQSEVLLATSTLFVIARCLSHNTFLPPNASLAIVAWQRLGMNGRQSACHCKSSRLEGDSIGT